MLIELLQSGKFKEGAFNTPTLQNYLLSFDLNNLTISVTFNTAASSIFPGTNQAEKKFAQSTLLNNMRLRFMRECFHEHNISLQSDDYVDQKISGDDTLIIKSSGVIKLIDTLHDKHPDEVYAEALYFIKELMSKDKKRITEVLESVSCIDYNENEYIWNYIYLSSELNKMQKLAEIVTTAMSNGIAFLIDANTIDIQATHYRKDNEDRLAIVMNEANYNKLTDIYDKREVDEAKKQPEQMQPIQAPAAANSSGRPAPRRVPSKYQGNGATDSTPKPKPNRAPPPIPQAASAIPATDSIKNSDTLAPPPPLPSSGSALPLMPTPDKQSVEPLSQRSDLPLPPPPSSSSSLPSDLNSVINLESAKKFLDEHIYLHEARYAFKTNYLKLIKDVFNKLSTQNGDDIIADLSDLYDYINEKERKEKVNLRENPRYDAFFFKANTKHWISTIREIRTTAYEKLIAIANGKFPGQSEQQKSFIQGFRDRKLFAEHLDNSIFNIFHDTKTVQQIDEQISLRTIKLN